MAMAAWFRGEGGLVHGSWLGGSLARWLGWHWHGLALALALDLALVLAVGRWLLAACSSLLPAWLAACRFARFIDCLHNDRPPLTRQHFLIFRQQNRLKEWISQCP